MKASSEELNQLKEQLDAKVASHQLTVEQLEQSVARARQEVAALTTQLSQVQRERVSYQTQAVELRTALHTALGQLSVSLGYERQLFVLHLSLLLIIFRFTPFRF